MPANEKKQIDAAKAQETEADLDTRPDPYVVVPLAGYDGVTKDVRALPATRWRASALRSLNAGDVDGFMASVLHEEDYDTYVDLDPDNEAIGHFAEKCAQAAGEALGKSSGLRPSSRSMRRR